MRVVITGLVVSNGGDAAILDGQLDLVRRTWPGASITVHDSAPAVARRLYPGLDVRPLLSAVAGGASTRLGRAVRPVHRARLRVAARLARRRAPLGALLLRRRERPTLTSLLTADVVAHTGGTTLIEKYALDDKLRELELARAAGAAVVLLPQSLGPFTTPGTVERVGAVVRSAALVLLRDVRSRQHLADLGADGPHVHVVPDIVFALGHEDAPERLRDRVLPDRPRVAISVRDSTRFLDGGEDAEARYEQAVADLATSLVREHGASVTFVSTCQGTPEYYVDDSAVADEVVARMAPDVRGDVVVDRERHDHEALTRLLGEHDLVVATRMHAGITALGAGTPVLPLAYEFKTREVMTQMGLGPYVRDVGAVTGEDLVAAHEQLVADLPGLRPALATALADLRGRARALDVLLRDAVAVSEDR